MSSRARRWPLTTEIVAGEPIPVKEHELVPLVRVMARVWRRAFVGNKGEAGHGWGFICMRPVAVLRRSDSGEQRLRFADETTRSILGLLLVALVVPVVAVILVQLARRAHDVPSRDGCANELSRSDHGLAANGPRQPSEAHFGQFGAPAAGSMTTR